MTDHKGNRKIYLAGGIEEGLGKGETVPIGRYLSYIRTQEPV